MTLQSPLLVLAWTLLCSAAAIEIPPEVPRPPRITEQPDEVTYAIREVQIVLKCAADAKPNVSQSNGYRWEKDGQPLAVSQSDNGSIVMSGDDGTIRFMGSERLSEQGLSQHAGVYQCFATNGLGTAMTNKITLKAAQSPYQRPEDQDRPTRLGQPLSLSCNFKSRPGQVITWEFDKPNVRLSKRISQTAEGGLVFSHITEAEDNLGVFCNVKDLATRKSTDGTHYRLQVDTENPVDDRAPEMVSPQSTSESQVHLRGDTLTLKCSATGKPTPEIRWEKLSGDWPLDRYAVTDFGQTVIITDASYNDTGDYRCVASNYLGIARATSGVLIQARPFFASEEQKPRDVVQTPGGAVEIRCEVGGLPMPKTSWMVDGIPIEETVAMANRNVSPKVITLTDLKPSDSAVYQCVATNKHGTVIEQAFVNVLTWPPTALASNKAVYQQVVGKSVDLDCHVFGSPSPSISWDAPAQQVPAERMQVLNRNSTLRINNVVSSDAGSFKCRAGNEYGQAVVDFDLEVLQPTQLRPLDGATQFGELGKPIDMKLELVVDEKLQRGIVRWEKDGKAVCAGLTCHIRRLSFADAGRYTVSVNTSLDGATTNVNLVVRDAPNAPSAFSYTTKADPLVVGFTWITPNNNFAPIEEYRIEYEEDKFSPGIWRVLKDGIPPTETTATVDLSPFVNYQFRVVAKNAVGWGKESNTVGRYQTPSGAPIVNPTGVTGEGKTSDNMVITWNPVKGVDQNGPGFSYVVSYCVAKTCGPSGPWMSADVDGDTRKYEVRGTPVYEKYLIKVRSVNSAGEAPEPEVAIGYSGEDTPAAYPLDVVVDTDEQSPTTAQLSWQRVSDVDVRGRLRGYQVEFGVPGQPWSKTNVGNVTTANLTGLKPDQLYQFAVSVFNSMAVGRRSEIVRKRTPESVPGAPTNLRLEDRTATTLTLNWDAPDEPNGVITGYVFVYALLNDTSGSAIEIALLDPGLKIENLSPDRIYQITVAAKTAKGTGPETAVLNAKTHVAGAPGKVDFNATVDESNVTVTWRRPSGLPADEFYVEVQKKGAQNWDEMGAYSSADTGKEVVISGLEPVSEYYVRLVAKNKFGTNEMDAVLIVIGGKAVNTGSITQEVWFIVVIALAVLLIVVLAVVCLLRKRKGGKYSVRDKEMRLTDPESNPSNRQEVGEYNEENEEAKKPLTPETTNVVPYNGDATSTPPNGAPLLSRTRGDSVGGDSIDALADTEGRGFDEDGSFIGQYGNMESTNQSAATSPGAEENYHQPNGDAV